MEKGSFSFFHLADSRRLPVPRVTTTIAGVLVASLLLSACTNLSGAARPAPTPLGCAREALTHVPREGRGDKRLHCLAGAEIALLCSPAEARLAAWGKEAWDAVSGGDADAEDARASLAGIECARRAAERSAIEACCAQGGH